MTCNWYAVYTKPHKELKVIAALNKKKIENFCPLVSVKEGRGEYARLSQQPLFKSLVFVYIPETEIKWLLSLPLVSTVAYWKSKPAVISENEIAIVRRVTETFTDIKLEKICVEAGREASIVEGPSIDFNENTVSVKFKKIKATLPSLGFAIIAEGVKEKAKQIVQQHSLFTIFPKRVNAFLFN